MSLKAKYYSTHIDSLEDDFVDIEDLERLLAVAGGKGWIMPLARICLPDGQSVATEPKALRFALEMLRSGVYVLSIEFDVDLREDLDEGLL